MSHPRATTFGSRLRTERVRLKLTQEEFAELGGVKRVSQHLYEQDVRVPDVNYLLKLQKHGVDVAALILDKATIPVGVPSSANIGLLTGVFRAVDQFARDDRGELLSLEERERFFRFLCMTLASDEFAVDAAELQHRLANFVRA